MVQLKYLLGKLWKASMRRAFASKSKSSAGISALFMIPLFFGIDAYMGRVDTAAHYLAMGEYDRANVLTRTLYLGWLFLPLFLLGNGLDSSPIQRLARLPLSPRQAFAVNLIDLLGSPFFYFLLLATLATHPLVMVAPSGTPAILAFAIFVFACIATLLTSSHLLALLSANYQLRRKVILVPAITVIGLSSMLLEPYLPQRRFMLATLEASPVNEILGLFLGTLILAALAYGLFLALLKTTQNAVATSPQSKQSGLLQRLPLLNIPNAHLFRLDLMHTIKAPETTLALVMALGACAFLLQGGPGLTQGFVMAQQITIMLATPMLSNLFGRDGSGIVRYQLMPLSGRRIILTKQVAALLPTALILIPLWIAAILALGFQIMLPAALQSIIAMALLASLGMHTTLSDPVPRVYAGNVRGFRSVITNLVLYSVTIALSLAPAISAWGIGDRVEILPLLIATPMALLVYAFSLKHKANLFERESEFLCQRLS